MNHEARNKAPCLTHSGKGVCRKAVLRKADRVYNGRVEGLAQLLKRGGWASPGDIAYPK